MEEEFKNKVLDFFNCFLDYVGPTQYQEKYYKSLDSWHIDRVEKPNKEEVLEKFKNLLDYAD